MQKSLAKFCLALHVTSFSLSVLLLTIAANQSACENSDSYCKNYYFISSVCLDYNFYVAQAFWNSNCSTNQAKDQNSQIYQVMKIILLLPKSPNCLLPEKNDRSYLNFYLFT